MPLDLDKISTSALQPIGPQTYDTIRARTLRRRDRVHVDGRGQRVRSCAHRQFDSGRNYSYSVVVTTDLGNTYVFTPDQQVILTKAAPLGLFRRLEQRLFGRALL